MTPMAVIGWVDSGLRLSREPQEGKTMTDTTETGRGSRPWEQGDVAAGLRQAFMDGAHWVSKMQTHEYLWDDIYKAMCLEVHRRYPDDDSQSRSGTGKVVAVKERPAMIVEDDEEVEWMRILREQGTRAYPPEYQGEILLATAARSALAEIEGQEQEIARLKSLSTSLNEQNVSLAESNTSLSLRLQIARDNAGQAGDEYCKLEIGRA